MNEFVAKKLGEVHAFVSLVIDTYQRGEAGFLAAMTQEVFTQEVSALTQLQARIESIANKENVQDTTLSKSAKTLGKITTARDAYVAERWDDTVELYEWSSFNAGAGSAHAHEVFAAGLTAGHPELTATMRACRNAFDALLADAKDYLYQEGVAHAREA